MSYFCLEFCFESPKEKLGRGLCRQKQASIQVGFKQFRRQKALMTSITITFGKKIISFVFENNHYKNIFDSSRVQMEE